MMILLELFLTFFKIGLFTFGGGYAMIPMIQNEVISRGWAVQETLTNFIAISESTPGPFAINIATFIGYEAGTVGGVNGILSGAVATLGVVMPSFIVILIIAKFFLTFSDNKYVVAALSGLRPAVLGLILAATFSVARATLVLSGNTGLGVINWRAILVAAVCFVISRRFKKLHAGFLMLIAAALGIALFSF